MASKRASGAGKKKSPTGKKSPTAAKKGKVVKPSPKANARAKSAPAKTKIEKSPGGTARTAKGELAVGAAAPAFALPDQTGKVVSSESFRGREYVLYFYPKDDTPGCTREACAFRDQLGEFQGVNVIGVSPDKPESHAKFVGKYGLNFPLLSDADKVLANAYGVWVKKQNYGREYMGIQRSTFFVGADGKIRKIWRNVKVDGHSAAVRAVVTGAKAT